VSRRVSLPGADELFRPTRGLRDGDQRATSEPLPEEQPAREERTSGPQRPARRPSGRVRHDEKITVYVTADELLDLEHTRLRLRREHGLAVDRGRLVREAIHLALEDAEEHGEHSAIVQRLRGQ